MLGRWATSVDGEGPATTGSVVTIPVCACSNDAVVAEGSPPFGKLAPASTTSSPRRTAGSDSEAAARALASDGPGAPTATGPRSSGPCLSTGGATLPPGPGWI